MEEPHPHRVLLEKLLNRIEAFSLILGQAHTMDDEWFDAPALLDLILRPVVVSLRVMTQAIGVQEQNAGRACLP